MPNFSLARLREMYLKMQSDALTLPSTVAASNYCLYSTLDLTQTVALIQRPDITGSLTALPGMKGRMGGSFAVEMSVAGYGTVGTKPDCDCLLQSAFRNAGGATGSPVSGYSYVLGDDPAGYTFAMYEFRTPSTLTQQLGMGCLVNDLEVTLGPDVAMLKASGDCAFVLDSENFSTYDTAWKGGLSAYPSKPTGETFHGLAVIGFTGAITIDSLPIVTLKNATIKIATGGAQVRDTFGTFISTGVESDMRTVSVQFTLDDSDGSDIQDLKHKIFSKAPVDMTFVSGTIAGNIWTWTLKGVQMTDAKYDMKNRRVRVDVGASTAHGAGELSGLTSLALTIS